MDKIEISHVEMNYSRPGNLAISAPCVDNSFSAMLLQSPIEELSSIQSDYTDRSDSFEGSAKGETMSPHDNSPTADRSGSGEKARPSLKSPHPWQGISKGVDLASCREQSPASRKRAIDPIPSTDASLKTPISQFVPDQVEKSEIGTVNGVHLRSAFSEPVPLLPAAELDIEGLSVLVQGADFVVQESLDHGFSQNEAARGDTLNPGDGYPGEIRDLLCNLECLPEDAEKVGEQAGPGLAETATECKPQGEPKNLQPDLYSEESGKMGVWASDGDSMLPAEREMRSTLPNGIKHLVLQLGLPSREMEKISGGDNTAFTGLTKLLFKTGRSEAFSSSSVIEQSIARNLKPYLPTQGVISGNPEDLPAAGKNLDTAVSPKEWMTTAHQETLHLSDVNIPSLIGKEDLRAGIKESGERHEFMVNCLVGGQPAAEEKASVVCEQLPLLKSHDDATQKVVEQVARGIRIQMENGQAEARISLYPPSLGKLHMHIVTRENQVRATFFAETTHVKEIIESNFPRLRESFLEQGMKIEHFNVFVGNQPSGNQTGGYAHSHAGIHCPGPGAIPESADFPPPEHTLGEAARNHMVDLFI